MSESADRYALPRSLAFGLRDAKVYHDAVRPTWSGDSSRFAYRSLTRDGVVYLLVEPKTRTRRPLFDPSALAGALAKGAGDEVDAKALNLDRLMLSHDGSHFHFASAGKLWRCRVGGAEPQETGPAPAANELLSPDNELRLYVQDHNLWLVDRAGQRRALTTDGEDLNAYGDFTGFESIVSRRLAAGHVPPVAIWSPDSRKVATMRADLRGVTQNHLVQSAPPGGVRPQLHAYPFPIPGDESGGLLELVFLDRDGGMVKAKLGPLVSYVFNPIMMGGWWDADSRHFHLIEPSRDAGCITLWRIDSETGEAQVLVREQGVGVAHLRVGGGGELDSRPLKDGRTLWWSSRDGWGQLYLVPSPGAPPEQWRQVTRGDFRVRHIMHVDEADERILFTAGGREPGVDPYFLQAYSIRFDGSDLKRLTPEDLNHDVTAPVGALGAAQAAVFLGYGLYVNGTSPDGRFFVDSFSRIDTPATSVLRDRDGALVMELETADASDAWPQGLPLPEPVHTTALDGKTELWGAIYRPLNFDPARRYPVVEVIYGGPQTAVVPKTFRQGVMAILAEQLAAQGFVAVILDGPGTPLRSRAFETAFQGRLEACSGIDEHIAAIRAWAADRPWMDLERMGVTGMSGGGYATVRAMGEYGDFYKAGVAYCGNHDQRAYISGWGDYYQGLYEPELYANQDNATVAGKISGPIFLIAGDMDDNVHPAHTLRIADAMIRADKDFDLLVVPNAGHAVSLHPYAARRAWQFLASHLGAE